MASKKTARKDSATPRTTKKQAQGRIDRRFLPVPTANPLLVRGLFGVGSMVLGGGSFAYFGRRYQELQPHPWAFWMMASGFVVVALAVWLGTSSETAVRVGPAGVAEDRGELRRVPWWAIEKVTYQESSNALVVAGKDLSGDHTTLVIGLAPHKPAVAHILAEAMERIPSKVEIPEDVAKEIGEPDPYAGMKIQDPVRVVGRKCRESGTTITVETDARVCVKCDAVYHREHTPAVCDCGARFAAL
jgi:hypothetical protein